jgi:hypothetical protein
MTGVIAQVQAGQFASFYSTAASVIATLYVALAVELRLLRPRDSVELPRERKERVSAFVGACLVLIFLGISLVGLMAALWGLFMGSGCGSASLTMTGASASVLLFGVASLDVLFQVIDEALTARLRRRVSQRIRRPALFLFGVSLLTAGTVLAVTFPHAPGC